MAYGITHDYPSPFDDKDKPEWLRQTSYAACACGICFFCKNGKTTGIQSKPADGIYVAKKSKLCSSTREELGRPSGGYCRECLRKRRLAHPDKNGDAAKNVEDI